MSKSSRSSFHLCGHLPCLRHGETRRRPHAGGSRSLALIAMPDRSRHWTRCTTWTFILVPLGAAHPPAIGTVLAYQMQSGRDHTTAPLLTGVFWLAVLDMDDGLPASSLSQPMGARRTGSGSAQHCLATHLYRRAAAATGPAGGPGPQRARGTGHAGPGCPGSGLRPSLRGPWGAGARREFQIGGRAAGRSRPAARRLYQPQRAAQKCGQLYAMPHGLASSTI